MQKKIHLLLVPFLLIFFSCTESQSDPSVAEVQETTEAVQAEMTEQEAESEPESVFESVPAVVLRDDASIWENENGNLSAKPIITLDMGTEVQYLGVDEDLTSGSKSYKYSKISFNDGIEGWISTVRLAKNSKPAVLIIESGLYSRPSVTSPINITLPAGQIVAVSIEDGLFDNFAKMTYSFYTEDRISAPASRYIPLENISSEPGDIDTAKLVLKAFRNDEQRNDFFNLAFSLDSNFNITGILKSNQNGYKYPLLDDSPITLPENLDLLAVNPQNDGESESWYLSRTEDGLLAWVIKNSVDLDSDLVKTVMNRPQLVDKSIYNGNGFQSVILYQGLSLRGLVKDENGNESFNRLGSLELGQVVYYMGDDRVFNDIEYSRIELANGSGGWCSKAYLAVDTVPAVITKSNVSQFKEAKLTSLSPVKIERFQIVALSLKEESGFFKISYFPIDKDMPFQKDVYIQKTSAPSSFMENDIDATILFQMCLIEEDKELAGLYLRKAAEIPSFFQSEISDLYYEAKGITVEPESSETE